MARWRVPFAAAFLLTLGFSIVLGIALERVVLRPLIGEPIISVIMVTLGLSSVLKAIVQGIWGTDTRPFPSVLPPEPVQIGPLSVSQGYLWSVSCVAALLVLFTVFFRSTRAGIAMRATAFSQQVALSMGISVRRIFALSWSIAAMVSAVGGMLLGAMRGGVDGSLAILGLKVLPAGVVGGAGSIRGAHPGGLRIGALVKRSRRPLAP